MARKAQRWDEGDIFAVPQGDGMESAGQVVSIEKRALNSVVCAFYDQRVAQGRGFPLLPEAGTMIALLFTTPDLLKNGVWRVCGRQDPAGLERLARYAEWRANGFIGARIIGSGIILKFLEAFYGLRPWDDWHDPRYLDALLISPERKPATLLYKHAQP